MFGVYDLLISTMQYLEENNSANKARKLKQIANKSHVVLMNGNFYTNLYCKISKYEI